MSHKSSLGAQSDREQGLAFARRRTHAHAPRRVQLPAAPAAAAGTEEAAGAGVGYGRGGCIWSGHVQVAGARLDNWRDVDLSRSQRDGVEAGG